jgi:TolA-binding protein
MLALPLVCVLGLSTFVDTGDDQYHFIAGLAEKGLHAQVVREAERFLDQHAGHPKADLARYRLATALFDLERVPEARVQFADLARVRGFEFAAEVAFRQGQCELEAGANDVAARAFERVLAGDADYLETPATFLLGEARFRAGRFDEAELRYAATLGLEDGAAHAADARHGLTWCAFRLGHYDDAVQRAAQFQRAYPEDPRVAELHFVAGESHLERKRPKDALTEYGAVTGGAFHAAALRGAGFACAELGDHRGAAQGFGLLLARYGDGRYAAEAALHRGIQLIKAGEPKQALTSLGLPAAGEGAEVLYWRGRALAELEDHGPALAAFEAGLALDLGDALARRLKVGRGDALFDLGRRDEAAGAYESAGSDYALHAAAVARLNDGAPAEAVRLATPLADPERDSPYRLAATLTLAEAWFVQGDYQQAEPVFAVVLAEDEQAVNRARAGARLGWCRYLSGDSRAARARFEALLERYPKSSEAAEARFMAGRAAEDSGDDAAAAKHLARYLEQYPRGEYAQEASVRLARHEPGQVGEVRLQGLLRAAPGSTLAPQAHYDLAERLAARQQWSTARDHYRAVVRDHPDHELAPGARYGLAWCLFSLNQHADALDLCELLARDPDGVEADLVTAALELAVWAAQGAGEVDRGLAACLAFMPRVADEPRRLAAARVAAGGLADAQRYREAEGLYAKLLELTKDPRVAGGACVETTYLALDRGEPTVAESRALAGVRYVPGDPELLEAFFFVGEALFAEGQDQRAGAAYARAATSPDPEVAGRALYKGGFAHLRRGDLDQAALCFETLVTDYPRSELFGESLFLLGEARYRQGKYAAAIAVLERMRRQAPRHGSLPKALFRLGVAHTRQEHWRQGAEVLGLLAKAAPDFPQLTEAELWRGRALVGLHQPRAARAAFERVIERDRGILAAQAHIELGRQHLAAGERDDALSKFLYVAVLFASPEEVSEALFLAGQVLESQNNIEAARSRYREALADYPDAAFTARCKSRLTELGD